LRPDFSFFDIFFVAVFLVDVFVVDVLRGREAARSATACASRAQRASSSVSS
jgi:hypothetical protein